MLTAGIFDLGGVVIDWNPRNLYRKLFPGDEAGMERFLAEVCTPAWNHELDRGRPFAEAIEELSREHPDEGPLIRAYWDRWTEMIGEVNSETVAIVEELKARGKRVFALSDWSAETLPRVRASIPALALFDDILISGEARITKPDAGIFELAAGRFGVTAAATFFTDDAPRNVDAAARLGFTALHFTGAAVLREDLHRLGAL